MIKSLDSWVVVAARTEGYCIVTPRGDVIIGTVDEYGHIGSIVDKNVAERIVACVNACKGLDTKELNEKGLVCAVGYELSELEKQNRSLQNKLGTIRSVFCKLDN